MSIHQTKLLEDFNIDSNVLEYPEITEEEWDAHTLAWIYENEQDRFASQPESEL